MGPVLALDYGVKRIGLAVTDRDRQHALAHSVVAAQPEQAALTDIARVVVEERVVAVVVGLPITLGGNEGIQARATRQFAERLRGVTKLPVEFLDERFTSRAAEAAARAKGTAADAEAARLILQTWLDRRAARAKA